MKSQFSKVFKLKRNNEFNILVLGIDGLDWKITNKLADSGALPNLEILMSEGVSGPLHTIKPTVSPYIWNTIFTGYMPETHQLRPAVIALPYNTIIKRNNFGIFDPFQTLAVLSSPVNREINHYPLSLWEILKRLGYQTAVIGTWELYPLNRSGYVNVGVDIYPIRTHTKLDLSQEYFNDDLQEFADSINIFQDEIPAEEWSFFTVSGAIPNRLFDDNFDECGRDLYLERISQFRQIYATDRFRFQLGKKVLSTLETPFCAMLYLQGIDITCHKYMHLYMDWNEYAGEEDLKMIVQKYYQKVDEWVGELVSIVPSNTIIFIVSDHGFDKNYLQLMNCTTGFHKYAPDGTFIIAGTSLNKYILNNAHVLDITPTILDLAGGPELISMEGRSILADSTFNIYYSDWYNMTVKSFEFGDPRIQNTDIGRKLKALGYIK
ncbi:alkaline phosphatase family protein [bacterium]|nr:alkaline phosphatase family protein [bacterium]